MQYLYLYLYIFYLPSIMFLFPCQIIIYVQVQVRALQVKQIHIYMHVCGERIFVTPESSMVYINYQISIPSKILPVHLVINIIYIAYIFDVKRNKVT